MNDALERMIRAPHRKGAGLSALAGFAAAAAMLLASAPAWPAEAFIHVNTPNLTLIPSAQDYANDYIDAVGSAGIEVKIKTNSPTGMILKVRSSGAGNTIRLGDLLVRTLTPAGAGGAALISWTPLALTDLSLWSVGVAQGPFATIAADVRIRNLGGYDDVPTGGFTSYAHTIVFTVLSP
jgi:hypothetical protein